MTTSPSCAFSFPTLIAERFPIFVETVLCKNVAKNPSWIATEGSVCKRPGRPADNRPAFSLARPGQCETDLGFVGQASWVPGGGGRLSAFGIFYVTSQYFVDVWVISADI